MKIENLREQSTQCQKLAGVASGQPLISVFIAAYNCAAYIARAIDSVLAQEDVAVEVIVVDDASCDATAAIAGAYEATGRVKVLINDANFGPSYSRNRAIAASRGMWLAQLDGDDWMAADRLTVLLAHAVEANADIVADNLYLVEDGSYRIQSTRYVDNGVPWRHAKQITAAELVRYDLGSVKPLLRREFLRDNDLAYPEDLSYGEDFQFLLRALMLGGRMVMVPLPLYCLRRGNTGSLTTHRARLFTQVHESTLSLLRLPEIAGQPDLLKALERRGAHLQRLIAVEEFSQRAREGSTVGAIVSILRRPSVGFALLRRFTEAMAFRLRRLVRRAGCHGSASDSPTLR